MANYKTRNIVLSQETFKEFAKFEVQERPMTLQGVVNKTFFLLMLLVGSAALSWNFFLSPYFVDEAIETLAFLSICTTGIGAFMVIANRTSRYLAPVYSIFEGALLGFVSGIAELVFPGIVLQAISITVGIFVAFLIIYKLKIIKPTANFKLAITSITLGITLFYLYVILARKMGVEMLFLHESSTGGIIFSVFVIIMAALNLIMDFDFIEQGINQKVPKYMEWYCAFGLMVTIIWLYLEVLNLLMKSRSKK
jgi:uncharacterized YccA/Bax inhibitor family protein